MKTDFTKFGFACLTAATMFGTASAVEIGNIEFKGFVKHISPREVAGKDVNARQLPQDPTVALKKAAQKRSTPSRFIGWNAEDPSLPNFAPASSEAGEKMDSVVGTYLTGAPMSKQTFEFTENGRPLECRNYIPATDGNGFQYAGHYEYEYDAQGRVISAEMTNVTDPYSCQRMEYGYNGDSSQYNLQIAYLMDAEGEWTPFQKGEYELDTNGNTLEEKYYLWTEGDVNDWVPVKKNVATYNEMNYMTSYFPYVWDAATNDWVGDTEGYYGGQSFEYTQNGDDAEQAEYEWIDGEWVKYYKSVYTYNDAALLIKKERLYWNREKQDWSGAESWGPWGDMKYNQYETYEYDEYGRNTVGNVFTSKSGEYVNYYRMTNSYTVLENGETEITYMQGSVKSDGSFAPYSKDIRHINKFGSEVYYCAYNENNGEWMPKQEEFRYVDEYNWFLGGDYYYYANGERRPASKERFIYPDDFNPTLGYETPIEGRHWVGGGSEEDEGWRLKHVDCFTWGPRDVMIGYVNYDYLQSDGNMTSAWETEYDFDADTANIFMWPDSNKGHLYYENKTLQSIAYENPMYWDGNNEWMPEYSYRFTYYYSPRTTTGVDAVEVAEGVVEVARYDLMGRRLAEPTEGVNIVHYSDGSSRKVMVKF